MSAITAFLQDKSTVPPLTLSIEGEWGSGKSSFLKQLKKELLSKRKSGFCSICNYPWRFNKTINHYFTIDFNPWRYGENEALWAAFAIEFERQLYKEAKWYRKLWFKLGQINYRKVLGDLGLAVILPLLIFGGALLIAAFSDSIKSSNLYFAITGSATLLVGLLPLKDALNELKGKISNNIMELKIKDYILDRPNYEGKVPFLDKFHEDIQKISLNLCGNDSIYVFIDDLDRCQPEQALELMQALNLLISEKLKVTFILAIDRNKIAAGYAAKYSDLIHYIDLPKFDRGNPQIDHFKKYAALKYGYEFLEKFIQVPFQLPVPDEVNLDQLLNQIIKFKSHITLDENRNLDSGKPSFQTIRESHDIETLSSIFKLEDKPAIAKSIMDMAAPALEHNPRKIKKFFNILRLHAYIGSQTGLFGKRLSDNAYEEGLSPIQLAKMLLIFQVWPYFIEHWKSFPYTNYYLLEYPNIQGKSINEQDDFKDLVCRMSGLTPGSSESIKYWAAFTYWGTQKSLLNILAYENDKLKFSVAGISFDRLLKVSQTYKVETLTKGTSSIAPSIGQDLVTGDDFNKDKSENKQQEPKVRIREATFDEIPGNFDDRSGNFDDSRYIQETKNPITGEWENPIYLDNIESTEEDN